MPVCFPKGSGSTKKKTALDVQLTSLMQKKQEQQLQCPEYLQQEVDSCLGKVTSSSNTAAVVASNAPPSTAAHVEDGAASRSVSAVPATGATEPARADPFDSDVVLVSGESGADAATASTAQAGVLLVLRAAWW